MKTLTEKNIKKLRDNYETRWIDAMLKDEAKVSAVLAFIERNKEILPLSFEQVFFSQNGFDVFVLNGEERVFCVPSNVFKTYSPLTEMDARGDWQQWLKKAVKIKEIR